MLTNIPTIDKREPLCFPGLVNFPYLLDSLLHGGLLGRLHGALGRDGGRSGGGHGGHFLVDCGGFERRERELELRRARIVFTLRETRARLYTRRVHRRVNAHRPLQSTRENVHAFR